VRELRRHASRYLARVAKGEAIEVTDGGRPVAGSCAVSDRRTAVCQLRRGDRIEPAAARCGRVKAGQPPLRRAVPGMIMVQGWKHGPPE
jgi:antitoxin (DNA-binding transcriptional repressor) of toxin-antitoxin stability system